MDVVLDGEEVGALGRAVERLLDDGLRVLYERGRGVEVVLGVEIKLCAMVSEGLHVSPPTAFLRAFRVWRSHVGRIETKDIPKGHLVLHHLSGVVSFESRPSVGSWIMAGHTNLVNPSRLVKVRQVVVTPCM